MNYIDIVLAILLFIAAIQGFRKGFIIEFASLAALILGIWGGIKFSDLTARFITKYTGYYSDYLALIAFFITFILIVILIHLMGKMLDSIVKAAMLGFLNRLAGIVFGVLKTALILSILLLLFDEVDQNVHILPVKQKEESKIYEPMKQVVPTLLPFIKLWDIKDKDKKEDLKENQKAKTKTT
ncbi:MAG: CvpA family protein [Methylococcaceae bacterium]